MDHKEVIDAQFDRAVEIVQSLPKNGPIQTGYEEKLAMYSLYKQATTGIVTGPRPPLWDMLGRAKWDAWAKHKNLDSYEAKWLYVDALLRVLHKYSDKTIAQDLVKELESYGNGLPNFSMSGSFSKSHDSSSSASSASSTPAVPTPTHQSTRSQRQLQRPHDPTTSEEEEDENDTEDDRENISPLASLPVRNPSQSQMIRPPSSISMNRYRTPMAGSLAASPPPHGPGSTALYLQQYPTQHYSRAQPSYMQPMPDYETPSAFPGPTPPVVSSPLGDPHPSQYTPFPYRRPLQHHQTASIPGSTSLSHVHGLATSQDLQSGSLSPMERAVVGVQASLAALQERLETLEASALVGTPTGTPYNSRLSLLSQRGRTSSRRPPVPNGLPWYLNWDASDFDWEHMGMWSLVLLPTARTTRFLLRILAFLLPHDPDKPTTPGLVVLRRILLDVSFTLCLIAVVRKLWRYNGMRRKEVVAALKGLWAAVVRGTAMERILIDKGV